MARQRSVARQLERELVRYARRHRSSTGRLKAAADDPGLVATTFTVDPDWRRTEGGRAARLGPRETIDLRGSGVFADHDPRTVAVGWRSLGGLLGVLTWTGVAGASWWLGRRGRGPLRALERDRTG